MTNQLRPANQPDRIVIELDVPTIKRMCHALGAHCPFNECFKDILYLTKVCEDAEEKYAESVREKAADEAKGNTIREYLTEQAAKKIREDAANPVQPARKVEPEDDVLGDDESAADWAARQDHASDPKPKPKTKPKPEPKRQFLQYGDKPS